MKKLKIGDRVSSPSWYGPIEYGTIIDVDGDSFGVRFDEYKSDRHDCQRKCEMGHGWYFNIRTLKLIESCPILSKQDLICKKIVYLRKKFEERSLIYDF